MPIITLEDLKNALEIVTEQQNPPDKAPKLVGKVDEGRAQENMGNAYYKIGQYSSAIECYSKHLEIAEELGDKGGVGRAHGNLGCAYDNIRQHQNAIECHRKQLEIAEELGDKYGVGRAHTNLGNAYDNICQYQKAIDCHRKQIEIAEKLGDKGGVGGAYGNLGITYKNIGQYQKAIECFRKGLEIAEELGDKGGVGRAHVNFGNAYFNIGQYQKAIESYRKALKIAEELGDKRGVRKAYTNLGSAYDDIGQYQKAIDCHRKNMEIAEKLGDNDGVRAAYGNLGIVYQNIGQYQKAIECYRKGFEIAEEVGDKRGVGRALGNLGNAYYNIGQYQKAIECYRRTLEIAEDLGDKGVVGKAHGSLGCAYTIIGQNQKAIECYRKYLEIAEELGDKRGVGTAQVNWGNCYYLQRQYQKAIVFVHQSLQIFEEIGDIRGKVIALDILGLCHQKDDVCLSSSFFAQSILSFPSIRRYEIDEDQFNTSLSNLSNDTHKSLFANLLNLKQVKAALLISDAGKAKALFDLTRRCVVDVVLDSALEDNYVIPIQAISEDPSSKTTEEFFNDVLSKVINLTVQAGSIISYTFDRRNNLHAWVVSKKGVFHKEWKTMNGMSAKTYLTTINAARDSVLQNMPKNISFLPKAYSNTYDTEIKDKFAELAVIGGKGDHENSYARDLDERVENLMRSDNSIEKPDSCDLNFLDIKAVKDRYSLDSSSNNQCGISYPAAKNYKEKDKDEERCLGCYSLEIPNAQSRTRKRNNYRQDPQKQETNIDTIFKKQYSVFISPIEEYLVGSKIIIVPEGSLFRVRFCALLNCKNEHLCEKYSLQFTPALHVLNACISKPLPKLGPALFVGNPTVREVMFNGNLGSQPPLPYATVEAKECSMIFKAEALLEENATKENVLNAMKDASVIHIAAHGRIDEADIFLAPNEGAPKPPSEEHYLLTAKDVAKCTLVARFVVLSCCHSDLGQISAEGVVGIARSFLGAGARSVLVTLCEIPDGATMELMKELMKEFYNKVVQGVSVCVALQQSMIELKKTYSIHAWSPFQIVGEDIALSNDEIK